MGTSSSYGGPGDRTPLLPAWALPPSGGAAPVPPAPPPQEPPAAQPLPTAPPTGEPQNPQPTPTLTPLAAPSPTGTWTNARRSFTSAVTSGTRASFRRAARDYVRAARGSGRASSSAGGGKRATAALGGFLSTAAGQGLGTALASVGLAAVVGRDVNEVLAAITNSLAPDGASKEEVAARQAIAETLERLYERFLNEGRDLTALETMAPADIAGAIAACVEAYVYNRWLGDLGLRIEQRTVTASEAVRLEREMREFIHVTVTVDMSRVDVMTLDWRGDSGRQFVENIYRDAYSLFGGEA